MSDFNHKLLGVFDVVIEAQKLELCIHKQNYMVEKLSENQFTNMSDDTVSISIIICAIQLKIHSSHWGKSSNLNLKLNYTKKMLVSLNILYAILEKPLNFVLGIR